MKINFKQPKYILPLILLPFLCLFFFVYHSGQTKPENKRPGGMNPTVGEVSADIKNKDLADKLDAYRDAYKEGDGMTAVSSLPQEKSSDPSYDNHYTDRQKLLLDSINRAMRARYQPPPKNDAMAEALKGLRNRQAEKTAPLPKERDPMEMFKQQMAYVDSMNKANDPVTKAEKQKKEATEKSRGTESKSANAASKKIGQ